MSANPRDRADGPRFRPTIPLPADRLPPQNLEAEMGVIAAGLLDNDTLDETLSIVRDEDMYRDGHRLFWSYIRRLREGGKPVDAILLADAMGSAPGRKDCDWERAGGDEAMATIMGAIPHAANAVFHAELVREHSIKRHLIDVGHAILADGYSGELTAEDFVGRAESAIFHVTDSRPSAAEYRTGRDMLATGMERIMARADGACGLPTGFVDLDDYLGGLLPGQLIVLAGRQAMGKTAIALNVCEHAALQDGKSVLFVSLEMGCGEVAERLLAGVADLSSSELKRPGRLDGDQMGRLGRAYDALSAATFSVDEGPSRTVGEIAALARRHKLRHGLDLLAVDYLQLVDPGPDAARNRSRNDEVAALSRRFKVMAKDLGVPVLLLSQLNRKPEERGDHRPRPSDLRDSGAIEQDADVVLLIHRPEVYDPNDQPGIAELIVAKHRNGATGSVRLMFRKDRMRFANLAPAGLDGPVGYVDEPF